MCINQRYIAVRTKILSPFHRERMVVPCKCGKCCECMAEKHGEWYFRLYHEWLDTVSRGGYVFFDTLTYADEYLPHLSEFFDVLYKTDYDFPCFSYEDMRWFMNRLRRKLDYDGYFGKGVRSFYCAEYGTSEQYRDGRGRVRQATHRPHYHVLFFVNSDIDVDTLHEYVDSLWYLGRTDKVRKFGDKSNYFVGRSGRSELAVSNYVAKYVQKVSKFQKAIDFRIDKAIGLMMSEKFGRFVSKTVDNFGSCLLPISQSALMETEKVVDWRFEVDDEQCKSYLRSEAGKKMRRDMVRLVDQFHRQSQGFGLSAIKTSDFDLDRLMQDGMMMMPDCLHTVKKIPVPKYYERKLFEEQIEWNGSKIWQPTKLGLKYRVLKDARVCRRLEDKFRCLNKQYAFRPKISPRKLAHYCVYERGRLDGLIGADIRFTDKLSLPNKIYNYSSPSDAAVYHGKFISYEFFSRDDGRMLTRAVPLRWFVQRHVRSRPDYDAVLERYAELQALANRQRQDAFDLLQELRNKKKMDSQLVLDF